MKETETINFKTVRTQIETFLNSKDNFTTTEFYDFLETINYKTRAKLLDYCVAQNFIQCMSKTKNTRKYLVVGIIDLSNFLKIKNHN